MADLIRLDMDGAVAIITLDNPPHNLIGGEFIEQYCAAQEKAVADGARAILVRSELRHFCAGADVGALGAGGDRTPAHETLNRLESIPIPTVAAVHGAVLGGGFELALACDFIVAGDSAQIGSVEVAIGLAPLLGAVQRLVDRAGPARAREIAMLGRRYSPEVLERWGIINLVVADNELHSASLSMARQLAAGPTVALGCIKRLVRTSVTKGVKAADKALEEELAPMWESNDVKRGMEAMKQTGPGTAIFEGN
ncbi:MAG: enoyl-CoA hydratase/isomerase family protein [Pseudomonadota bacterium]